ncbi:hypothetical protein JOF48_003634 [Arthrobacter stackebrandtii]|uniref:Uncharacterized protein n=1 Tax=Arthrobacter stackebrandtii TaxID=272161 RepID=A0ABS4Z1D0_9MICC|nr:hypothetical protein [Arthrobacter stackebrandtii]MBP2414835.1 hypothetical protein [Arthrobacter stackebrandtii]PYG99492.1 hypothetical protein CVV67_15370 [Arthrobacter stackebrandtii]
MLRLRNYWIYSAGLGVVWAIALLIIFASRGPATGRVFLLVFGRFCIGWVSTTIARFVYPPPKRWGAMQHIS